MPIINSKVGFVDAVDPDLKAFKARGGKLFLYAGWGDTSITPENTVLYYESVLNKMGKNQGDWMRLFMVPGMAHCRGGLRPEQLRLDRHARSVARERRGAGAAHRGESANGDDTSDLPIPAVCEVQGNRQLQGRRELDVRGAVTNSEFRILNS